MSPHLIAFSQEHDGVCDFERRVVFHEAENEANPAFVRYRVSWTDALGCSHFVRYDLAFEGDCSAEPKAA